MTAEPHTEPPAEPTTIEKLHALRWSYLSNSANTIFSQFTFFGSAFVLLLSTLGMSKPQIGFLLSLLPFAGLVALFIAPAVARFGYKRTYVTFFALRKVAAAGLLLTPWVASNFGARGMYLFVMLVVGGFALNRAISEVGYYPWYQEFIPNSVRGRFAATNSIFTTIAGLAAVSIAGFVLAQSTDLSAYMGLIGAGVLLGLVSVWSAARVPGGAPVQSSAEQQSNIRGMLMAARDGNFIRYLAGAGFIIVGTVPMISFLPLFMQEQVGLSSGSVVLLQTGSLAGNLLSSMGWGWASDRYGSKPIMMSGLALKVALPIMWFLMPRNTDLSLPIALGIAFLLGISDMAWGIGAGRLLFVSVVPPAHKVPYMALHYAWVGAVGGLSQLVGGWLLSFSSGLSGQFLGIGIDPYTPLFALGAVLTVGSALLLARMRADNIFGVGQFAGLFLRGNPFQAMSAMVRYYMARDERSLVSITQRLGQTRSPLAVDELLQTVQDPRFNVRFEAVIAMARMPVDQRLTQALLDVLNGTELALSSMAAWALGRIGDASAVPPLQALLDSPYRSIRAHSARALGAIGDPSSVPLLVERLATADDRGLQMAYAYALGLLGAERAVPLVVALLTETKNLGARLEIGLSLARMAGNDRNFVHLLRRARADLGTTMARELESCRRAMGRHNDMTQARNLLRSSFEAFTLGEILQGAKELGRAIEDLPPTAFPESVALVLHHCATDLQTSDDASMETLVLAIHMLNLGLTKRKTVRTQSSHVTM